SAFQLAKLQLHLPVEDEAALLRVQTNAAAVADAGRQLELLIIIDAGCGRSGQADGRGSIGRGTPQQAETLFAHLAHQGRRRLSDVVSGRSSLEFQALLLGPGRGHVSPARAGGGRFQRHALLLEVPAPFAQPSAEACIRQVDASRTAFVALKLGHPVFEVVVEIRIVGRERGLTGLS
nr:hypothetical protein [Tanacetum cinerariifolium]